MKKNNNLQMADTSRYHYSSQSGAIASFHFLYKKIINELPTNAELIELILSQSYLEHNNITNSGIRDVEEKYASYMEKFEISQKYDNLKIFSDDKSDESLSTVFEFDYYDLCPAGFLLFYKNTFLGIHINFGFVEIFDPRGNVKNNGINGAYILKSKIHKSSKILINDILSKDPEYNMHDTISIKILNKSKISNQFLKTIPYKKNMSKEDFRKQYNYDTLDEVSKNIIDSEYIFMCN